MDKMKKEILSGWIQLGARDMSIQVVDREDEDLYLVTDNKEGISHIIEKIGSFGSYFKFTRKSDEYGHTIQYDVTVFDYNGPTGVDLDWLHARLG